MLLGSREHLFGRVDAEDVATGQRVREPLRERPGTAAEVDHAHAVADVDERQQVLERSSALLLELFVAFGIPGDG